MFNVRGQGQGHKVTLTSDIEHYFTAPVAFVTEVLDILYATELAAKIRNK